ncbi:ciliary microtubule inner protein 1 isoform X3 [Rhineura floridana]|uniref:ciliary microtubule inner protein 1 isoform X3 n=1 Tax=Rhineura floridana TaxID=261503 RepID=UPI002AC8447E|nr:ciliary microtubule inner protein 1 isoform X3 [Rhineura floridana]
MSQKNKLNFVAEDQIWKDHVETEHIAARRWPKRWGFLLTPAEELIKGEKKQPAKPKIPLPEHLQIRPVTPVEKYIKLL